MATGNTTNTMKPPSLKELDPSLTDLHFAQKVTAIFTPFLLVLFYMFFAAKDHWVLAFFSVVYLSFVTYGSISHDYVHGNYRLPKWLNRLLLSLTELLMLRSGTAYYHSHLNHHKLFPHSDDIEGQMSGNSLLRTLIEGPIYHIRLWAWCFAHRPKARPYLLLEGLMSLTLFGLSIYYWDSQPMFLVYMILVVLGSWPIPLITAYFPHNPEGGNELLQTRLFRGSFFKVFFLNHLYHLEHHLYPSVPHQNWSHLANLLDPYFQKWEVPVIRRDLF